ncbi:MAG: class GN sortase [Hyphomicrobiaceae bacterium]
MPQLRSPAAVVAIILAGFGLYLFSQGIYIHAKAVVAQVLLRQAFVQTIATGKPVKPWAWADTWPVAKIDVPRLGAQTIVLAGASGQALAFGPGHVSNTKLPGQSGTAIFAAHRDTHFQFLGELKIGDEIQVTRNDGQEFSYRVFDMKVTHWDHNGIDVNSAGKTLVLATCWPLNSQVPGDQRYLVYADLDEN